jgi:hypothetical protein
MSVEAMTWVWKNSPYRDATLVVHLAVADVVNDVYQNEFFMSVPSLAVKARCSQNTARRALHAMLDDGLIEILTPNNKGGRSMPNRYRFIMPKPSQIESVSGEEETLPNEKLETPETLPSEKLNPSTMGGAKNTSNTSTNTTQEREAAFAEFWSLYPRKHGKVHAAKAFEKAAVSVGTETILVGLKRLLPSLKAADPKFVKYPATWLNGGCWDDEVDPVVSVSALKGNAQIGQNHLGYEIDGLKRGELAERLGGRMVD